MKSYHKIEYDMIKIFIENPYTNFCEETSSRPFLKNNIAYISESTV